MRYGLLSDVHANLPALRAVVAVLERHGVDGWLCVGDVVGYGPHPGACVELLADLGAVTVHGNHELMLGGHLPLSHCGPDGAAVLRWTRTVLGDDRRAWLDALPAEHRVDGLLMTHAALGEPERYLEQEQDAAEQLDALGRLPTPSRLLLVGHTHHPWIWGGPERATAPSAPSGGPVALAPDERYLINPGAVGQSRRREPRPLARAMLLDLDAHEVVPVAVPYDHRATRAALHHAGLPPDGAHQRPGVLPAIHRRVRRIARRATSTTSGVD